MDIQSTKILFPLSLLILMLNACQPADPATAPDVEGTMNILILTLTSQAAVISTSEAANAEASETPAPASEVPLTETPSVTPTDTSTFTPSVPMVSVTSETNCRTGPTRYYKLVVKIEPETRFVMVGKHSPSGYWIIRLENGSECWLWGEYALPEGNWASLPERSQPQIGRIEGTVQKTSAADAQKIADAFVNIGLINFTNYETGNNGFFVFEDVPAGEVNLTTRHSSFMFTSQRVIVRAGDVTVVSILPVVPQSTALPTPGSCPPFLPRCSVFSTQLPAQR